MDTRPLDPLARSNRDGRRSHPGRAEVAGELPAWPRAASAIAISEVPPNTMLIPTRSPIAHAALPGRSEKMMAARIRSMTPLAMIQPDRLDASLSRT